VNNFNINECFLAFLSSSSSTSNTVCSSQFLRECSISVRAYAYILLAVALVEGAIFTAFYFVACPEAGHDVLQTENKLFLDLLRLEPNETVYLGIYADGVIILTLIGWLICFFTI